MESERGTAGEMKRRKGGFTLIELLAVMAIMAVLAGIAVASYFTMARGSAMRAAVSHLRNSLMLARQMAVLNGRSTYVIVDDGGYAMCMAEGTASGGSGIEMWDEFADFSELSSGVRVFNLDSVDGQSSTVTSIRSDYGPPKNNSWGIQTADSIWGGETKYGWEVHPKNYFPKGFRLKPGYPKKVVFRADGTIHEETGYEFNLFEEINPTYIAKVSVDFPTGKVEVN
jgi:prepilin-type N-terminal cleavage/methylation domain-containing protein